MTKALKIFGINGPLVSIKGQTDLKMGEMVYVGGEKLVGEVIRLTKEMATIQVFEETSGLKPGETIHPTGATLSVTLAPGIVRNIFDGIERPLTEIARKSGTYIDRGFSMESLDTQKKWAAKMCVRPGDYVTGGTILAEVPETPAITHKVMVPPGLEGRVETVVPDGEYTINDTIVTIMRRDDSVVRLTMTQKWPIRVARPSAKRHPASRPLVTGQRILDTLFPIAKGGTAAIPGGFGTGKTMTQHAIAKWSDADLIVYIGCGGSGCGRSPECI